MSPSPVNYLTNNYIGIVLPFSPIIAKLHHFTSVIDVFGEYKQDNLYVIREI
jgi:hypothetical protein